MQETQQKIQVTPQLIKDRMDAHLEKQRRTSVHRSNWASLLGEVCDRARYYYRICPEKAAPIDLDGLRAINNGIDEEKAFKDHLSEIGFAVFTDRPEKKGRWEEYNISAWADLWVSDNGSPPVMGEHKAPTVEWTFQKISCEADLKNAESPWHRKWYFQCQTTMIVHNEEKMLFFLKRPGRKEWKVFWIHLSLEDAEIAVKRAELDESNVKSGNLPLFLKKDPEYCQRCKFFGRVCNPELEFKSAEFSNDPETIAKFQRHEELKPAFTEYNKLDKIIKKPFKTLDSIGEITLVGPFQVTVKATETKGYTVDPGMQFRVKIQPVTEDKSLPAENEGNAA